MTKGIKWLIVILIGLSTLFAAGSGYFYAKTISLEKKSADARKTETTTDSKLTNVAATTTNTESSTTTTLPQSAAVEVTASSTDSRPSSPSDTVVVGQGDTLFAIGQKTGATWTQIAEVNAIDANKIKVGQTLIIPKNNQVSFTVNNSQASSLQKDVDAGKLAFRLSPLDTAKADSPTVYGLASTDVFTQTKIDETAGSATINVVKSDKTYTITLIQSGTKGAKGIWAIESIKPNNN